MVAVKTENGDYSIFENIGGEDINVGDQVEWANDTVLGDATLKIKTAGRTFQVYFQNHHVSLEALSQQLLLN
jgi:hypothetical protein